MGEHFEFAARLLLAEAWRYDGHRNWNLSRLLAEYCQNDEECHMVEIAILETLDGWPMTVTKKDENGEWVSLLPDEAMAEVVQATTAEVYWLMRGVCEEIASHSLRFDKPELYVRGRPVARWRKEKDGDQIALLKAFQSAGWSSWIENPFSPFEKADQTVKNLNKKVKKWVGFRYSWDRVGWVWPWQSTRH